MSEKRKGLIIVNLGSPDSASASDVGRYLNEFLMDERVIDIPAIPRQLLVKGLIVPFRKTKSAKAYQSIWTEAGSPLKVITKDFAELVAKKLQIPVVVAMRYGSPNPADALKELQKKAGGQLDEILIAPMYPHYAMSSYETALLHITDYIKTTNNNIALTYLKPFYNEPGYISSVVEAAQPMLDEKYDAYLFSYHGLPIRHLKKTDPTKKHCYSSGACCEVKSLAWQFCYKHQAKETTRLVTEKLNLDTQKVIVSFQSRLGSDKWIQPFTDKLFEDLPKQGVKKLMVFSLSFVADCLETLEELDERGKEQFIKAGGETFTRSACLNTSPLWINTFADYCEGYQTTYKDLWGSFN